MSVGHSSGPLVPLERFKSRQEGEERWPGLRRIRGRSRTEDGEVGG